MMRNHWQPSYLVFAVIIIVVALLYGMASEFDIELEKLSFLRYCERVELYMETEGELGHRDYRDLWNECREVLHAKP